MENQINKTPKPKKSIVKYLVGIIVILLVSLLFSSNTIGVLTKQGLVCFTYNDALLTAKEYQESD